MKILACGLVLFLIGLTFKGSAAGITPTLPYFLSHYDDSRRAFRSLGSEISTQFSGVEVASYPIVSDSDPDLTVDTLYVPAQIQAKGLVIIVSGTHGTEAFAGSAVQRYFLREIFLSPHAGIRPDTKNTGYLFVHALNPYGFKNFRRVTENNVDLNRNFSSQPTLYQTTNDGYERLADTLNPTSRARYSLWSDLKFWIEASCQVIRHGKGKLQQAIAQGQYQYPRGIFFGGHAPEPQVGLVERVFGEKSEKYQKVLILDLHTGFGKRGYMHLLPNPPESADVANWTQTVFSGHPVEISGKKSQDFYSSGGDLSTYVAHKMIQNKKRAVPMLIEFGTINSQTPMGALRTLFRVILENEMHFYGARNPDDGEAIRTNYAEMFIPSDAGWREAILSQVGKYFPIFLKQFSNDL